MGKKSGMQKGSAMLWAVLVMLMVTLISGGIVLISRIYYIRERDENNRMQAKLYAESAIELIRSDIETQQENSSYVSDNNTTKTFIVQFPDASNWKCTITINHSVIVPDDPMKTEEENKISRKKSGEVYLTAKVTRKTSSGKTLELSEVCAQLVCNKDTGQWEFKGYYNL